jgi:hypothetical protein
VDNDIELAQVTGALTKAGLRFQVRGRYIVSQCPKHEERNPSCQIFLDDWFCSCLAGCGRFHISHVFPELRTNGSSHQRIERRPAIAAPRQYKSFDLLEEWSRLPLIPRSHEFKGLPLEILDDLGWRWDERKNSYFIPYWDGAKKHIPFAQWRHLSGSRRFTFLAGARPKIYGHWNIRPGERLFIVEGTSDCAVLERCGVPWIGVPSASSGSLLQNFAKAAQEMDISLVYAGDNDEAGSALVEALEASGVHYRVRQPPAEYKDWGDFYVADGDWAVLTWCKPYLFE